MKKTQETYSYNIPRKLQNRKNIWKSTRKKIMIGITALIIPACMGGAFAYIKSDDKSHTGKEILPPSSIADTIHDANQTNGIDSFDAHYSKDHMPNGKDMFIINSVQKDAKFVKSLYNEGKISKDEFDTYIRSRKYIETISKVESIILLDYLKYVIGAESDFIPHQVSRSNALQIGQLKEIAIDELVRVISTDKAILKEMLDINKVETLKINDYASDIGKICLSNLDFDEEKFERAKKGYGLQKEQIKSVIIPRYLKLKELFPGGFDEEKALNDPHYNIIASGAYLLHTYLELSSLQLLKEPVMNKKGRRGYDYKYVYRLRSFFDVNPELGAFEDDDIKGAYNMGPTATKKAYIKEAKDKRYSVKRAWCVETGDHSKRIKDYMQRFKNLHRFGVYG